MAVAGGAVFAKVRYPEQFAQFRDKLQGEVLALLGKAPPASSDAATGSDASLTSSGSTSASPAPVPAVEQPKVWAPPAVIPAQADWTWTTAQKTYHKVQILKVEADCVTILDDEGGALVPISALPADVQRQLNYDPAAAALAAAARQRDDAASGAALARERASDPHNYGAATDYQGALAQAKQTGARVLLHFTGSDWCPYCKYLESEVIETGEFQQFVGANYIMMTLDFPHDTALPPDEQKQNNALASKFGVSSFPTLLVIDGDERVLGRISGYGPGMGPGPIIAQLKSFH